MNMELVYKQLDELLQMGRIEETEDFLIAAMGRAQQEGDYNSLIALLNEMTGYQKETGKPDKAVAYGAQAIELMKQLGMTKTAVFGTTLLNVANACREAGIPFILADYGFGDVPDPDARIQKPLDLISMF